MEGISRMMSRHRRRAHRRANVIKALKIIGCIIVSALIYNRCAYQERVVDYSVYNAKPGDTLWSIAKENVSENMDINDYVYSMYELNEGLSADIKSGQVILLPIYGYGHTNDVGAESLYCNYTALNVPQINSSCKRWMDYRKITNRKSLQYKFISQYGWVDNEGFMRCGGERDLGITDDYYMIALGSYYGTTIGTKYKITTSTGNVFYGVLADCKSNAHTNSTHQYSNKRNPDIVEFLVDTRNLNKDVKRIGSANAYMPLNGNIEKIERIDFNER